MVRIVHLAEGALVFRSSEEGVLEFAVGPDARDKLAKTLTNLSLSSAPSGPVRRHVDLEYFLGHPFLADTSMWVTIFSKILVREHRAMSDGTLVFWHQPRSRVGTPSCISGGARCMIRERRPDRRHGGASGR